MSKRFLSGTYLAPYEFMMQQTPAATSIDKYEKKAKGKYISFLKQYMREYGYREIIRRVMKTIGSMVFDNFLFCSEDHRDMFLRMYCKRTKGYDNKDNLKTAVIYLLSANNIFKTVLENYVSNPLYEMPTMIGGNVDEEVYSIYHAIKMLLGMESGLYEEDLFDNEVLSDKVLCLVINAKLISQYGIHGYLNKSEKQNKPRYINTPHKHNRKSCTYEYGGKQIRIN